MYVVCLFFSVTVNKCDGSKLTGRDWRGGVEKAVEEKVMEGKWLVSS